jgi:hypothetical protein
VRRLEAQRSRLGELAGVRTKVSDFSMPMGEMAGWYTTTIGGLLDVIGTMGTLSQDADITRSITAYIAFLQAKERAGIERAMGSNGFSAGAFAPAVYQRYVGLIAEQTAFQSLFRAFAAPELISALDGVLAAPAAKEVDRMRAIALESPQTGSTGGVAGADWFKTITAKIDGLKGVEDLTAAALLKQAKAAEANAFQAFLTTLAVVVLLLAATAGLVTIVVRGITRPIAMLTRDMGLLAQGDRTVSIDGVERGDEIGAMSRAVQVFKDAMIANDRLQEELNHHATHDPLTGALNRRAFALLAEKQVAQAARTGRPLAVLMMDLDHFKRINDTLGHSGATPPCAASWPWPGTSCGPRTCCAASAARNSSPCCPTPRPPRPWPPPNACAWPSPPPAPRSASASPACARERTWRTCCVAPTPPCTMPSGPAATAPTCPRRWPRRRRRPLRPDQQSRQKSSSMCFTPLLSQRRFSVTVMRVALVVKLWVASPDTTVPNSGVSTASRRMSARKL